MAGSPAPPAANGGALTAVAPTNNALAFTSNGGGAATGGGGMNAGEHDALQRRFDEQAEAMKTMRGEIARLKVANELMNKEMMRLKTLVGAKTPGAGGGIDVDDLASKGEIEALRTELGRSKRQAQQERELAKGSVQAELDELKRALRALEIKTSPDQ